jgi:hypothetical protein
MSHCSVLLYVNQSLIVANQVIDHYKIIHLHGLTLALRDYPVFQGTGSYPPLHHGLQRKMRQILNRMPRKKPCLVNASHAYWEQVGVKRHEGGIIGLMQY